MRLMYKWISDITTLLQYNRVTSLEQLSLAEFSGEWYGARPMINKIIDLLIYFASCNLICNQNGPQKHQRTKYSH